LRLFARQFPCPPDGFTRFARLFFGWLLVGAPTLHFTKNAFALKLFLKGSKGLVDIIVANENLQNAPPVRVNGSGSMG
jgi:hypothetical protein